MFKNTICIDFCLKQVLSIKRKYINDSFYAMGCLPNVEWNQAETHFGVKEQ